MKRVRVIIRGDVQNVGFRSFVKHKAKLFSVKGWVKNNVDGSVEAVFESSDAGVKEMLDACKRGPPGSYVEGLKVEEEDYKGEFTDFRIAD